MEVNLGDRETWIHIALVVTDEEFLLYHDGIHMETANSKRHQPKSDGPGRVVIGKRETDGSYGYGSVKVDELMFWNIALNHFEIEILANIDDECESNPCRNNATCRDGLKLIYCQCSGDRQGQFCEKGITSLQKTMLHSIHCFTKETPYIYQYKEFYQGIAFSAISDCMEQWDSPPDWSAADKPAIYRSFDEMQCISGENGAGQAMGKVTKLYSIIAILIPLFGCLTFEVF